MLRFVADMNDLRQILMIWSNKTKSSLVLPEEFKKLQQRLPHLRLIHVFTRCNNTDGGEIVTGRLDQAKIDRLLEGYSRQSEVFVCGPPMMMADVSRMLSKAGFGRASIHTEKFQF
jgi:ferredoxin-NADP reductase